MKKTLILFFIFSFFSTSEVFAVVECWRPGAGDPCCQFQHNKGNDDLYEGIQNPDFGDFSSLNMTPFPHLLGRSAGGPTVLITLPNGNNMSPYCSNCPAPSYNCIGCINGYTLYNGNCYPTANSCGQGKYLINHTCQNCTAGTYQNQSNYTGSSCTTCPSGQTSGPGAASCSAAITCSEHCTTCTSETNCTVCATGYYVADGQCVERKTKCGPGYKLVKTGSASNDKTCIACDPGTEQTQSNYTGSTCTPCPNGATSRTPGSNCDMCMRVYPLSHYGMCGECDPEYCLRGLCEGEPNTTWSSVAHDCVPLNCSEHCTLCTSETNCTTCEAGYILQGGACVHAQARCQAPYVISDDGCCCVKAE